MSDAKNVPIGQKAAAITAGVVGAGVAVAALNVTFAAQQPYMRATAGSVEMTGVTEQLLEARMRSLTAETDTKVSALNGRLDTLSERVSSLLGRFNDFVSQHQKVPQDLATLTERVSHLPTKGWMVTGMLSLLGGVAALITFSEKLHALLN